MSSPPAQRQRQNGPNEAANSSQAAAAMAAAAAMRQAASAGVVRICGTSPSECGYCKGSRAKTPDESGSSSQAYSLLGDFMTPETYEQFLYRGWRRSGTYLYKPNNWISCCPALTIRLPVKQFVPSKSQRKVVKKMDQILKQPQPPQEGTKRGHKRKLPSQSTEETMIEQGHVLEQLQQWTQPILQSLLEGYAASNSQLNLSNLKAEPTFKIRPPPGKKKPQREEPNNTPTVKVCTTVCAALAGQSKGAVNRDQLSQQLVDKLQAAFVGKSNPLPNGAKQSSSTWTIIEVTRHAKSGQVFCDILLQDTLQNGNSSQRYNDDASMKDATSLAPDKLQLWLQDHGPSMVPLTHPLTQEQNPQPPYPFTMETVPAHQSALDPAVHKLYFLYQSRVHQDADPFTCDLSDKEALNSSTSNMNIGSDDASQMEDDEWSTPATSDGNDVLPQDRPGRLTPPPAPPAAASSYNRNPPGFVDNAKRMLQREYAHMPNDRLKQIVKSFGSFYQFLVESPFTLPTNGHAAATATVTNTPSEPSSTTSINLPAGTYHQQYRVAGMLIAVGVVDILPQGLSSVYLFYHPQFARDLVPLGKYAILQEIEFARSLNVPYYYLGYYIESCTKMRYKAEYKPSQLLCPTTYKWVDAALAQRILPVLSPSHHCCTLYYEDQDKLEADLKKAKEKLAKEKQTPTKSNGSDDDMSMDDHPATASAATIAPSPQQQQAAPPSTGTAPPTKSILKKPNPSPFPPNPLVEQVKMDVGVGVPVTLSMLHERGRDTVRPLLEEFVKESGPQLSQKCLVKFN